MGVLHFMQEITLMIVTIMLIPVLIVWAGSSRNIPAGVAVTVFCSLAVTMIAETLIGWWFSRLAGQYWPAIVFPFGSLTGVGVLVAIAWAGCDGTVTPWRLWAKLMERRSLRQRVRRQVVAYRLEV